jgi:plastocyanin
VSTGSVSSKARVLRVLVVLATAVLAFACGGSDNGASTPTTPDDGPTFTITSAGVSPKTLTVAVGSQVTFINNDKVSHQMFSDPHPEHMDCPEINSVGFLSSGQTKQTGNLNTVRTCGFHDHEQPLNTFLQGSILIR